MPPSLSSPRKAAAITGVLALLSVFPPLATDMYLSAMGDVADALGASHGAAELSLSAFFLGLCVGQLIMGPLIDGYGRKAPLLGGVVLFVLTSLALLTVQGIGLFIALRFLQALGACAGMVVSRAVVSDLYEGRKAAKVMTVLVMLLSIGPIISPTLGSLLLEGFGWHSIFVAMAGVGLVALALSMLVLPETLPAEARVAAPFASSGRSALALLRHRAFVVPAVVAGLVQGGMFAFITGSSGVFQGTYGLGSLAYGLLFALIAAALVLFGQLNNLLLNRFGPRQILRGGLPLFALGALAVVAASGSAELWVLVVPLWLTIGMVGLLSANATALAMAATEGGAGLGSALLGAVQFALAFAVSAGVALGRGEAALPMALGLLVPAVLALGLWWLGRGEEGAAVKA